MSDSNDRKDTRVPPQLVHGLRQPLPKLSLRSLQKLDSVKLYPKHSTIVVRPELPGIAVADLQKPQGKLATVDSKLTFVPIYVAGNYASQNPPVHVIIEDSSWNQCHDNTEACYNFQGMTPHRKQTEEQLMQTQQLFNEEPPVTIDEARVLLEAWADWLRDSQSRRSVKVPTVSFQQVTVQELAKQSSSDTEQFVSLAYRTPIILTSKTPQKFWSDLYDDNKLVQYSEEGQRARSFIKNHLEFMLVCVTRLPIQWYYGKKSRQLPDSWWQTGSRLNMTRWQKERYNFYYSIPQMFLNRSVGDNLLYDVVYNYVPERHLVFLRDLTSWSLPSNKERGIGKWWSSLKQFGFMTDKGKTWDRPAIIVSYSGLSVSPYTFQPHATKASKVEQPGDIASGSVQEIFSSVEAQQHPQPSQSSDVKDKTAAPSATRGYVPSRLVELGLNAGQDLQFLMVAAFYDMALMIDQLTAECPADMTAEEWKTVRRGRGLPSELDEKSIMEYLRNSRDLIATNYMTSKKLAPSDHKTFLTVLDDSFLQTTWNGKTLGKGLPVLQATPKQENRSSVAGRARVAATVTRIPTAVANRCNLQGCTAKGTSAGEPWSYICSYCHGVGYCSVRHMELDWPRHGTTCPQNVGLKA